MKQHLLLIVFFLSLTALQVNAQKQGQALIDSLLSELPKMKDDSNGVLLLHSTSFAYSKVKPDSGIWYAQMELDLAKKTGWKKGEAKAHNNFGNCYNNKSEYALALDNYFKALSIVEDIGDKKEMSIVLGNLSLVYQSLGKYDKALENQFKALRMTDKTDRVGMEYILGNIGITYSLQGKYNDALEYQQKALKIAEEINDHAVIVSQLINISNTYKAMKNYSFALAYANKSLRLAITFDRTKAVAANLGNIGSIYLNIAKDTGYIKPDSLIPAGKAAIVANAIEYLGKGITACREIDYKGALQSNYQAISDAYALAGNYKDALVAFGEYTAVKDSIFSTESNIKIANLETKREVELKDKQLQIDRLEVVKKRNERGFFIASILGMLVVIIFIFRNYRVQKIMNGMLTVEKQKVEERTEELNITNNELNTNLENLKETQKQLIVTEKQKENEMIRSRIAMDIHDDVSSELTRISWVSELAKLKFKKADMAELPSLLEKITLSSRQTIGKLAEIIWTVKPENDNIENLITYMRNYIGRFFTDTSFAHTIDFPEQLPPLPINPELKRNLFLVVKETLNNAVKYSQAKHIHVSFRLTGDSYYSLTIKDDGKGIDENIIEGGGNGLKNMRNRMKDIKGSCTIDSHTGEGTTIIFEGVLY